MSDQDFFTFREYMRKEQEVLSPSAEDYVEMIYRLSEKYGFTRVNDLAAALNVQPPSVTKMIQKLSEMSLIRYVKYGVIMLEPSGMEKGKALLERHNTVEEFLRLLGMTEGLLDETEKLEHMIDREILAGISNLIGFFAENPDILKYFNEYRKTIS